MNRFHSCGFIVIVMMSVAMVLSTPGVSAETRVDAGYVYIDGRNEARRPGASMWEEDYNDWRQVDRGHGAALSFRRDWTRLYAKGSVQRLTLANRNEYRTLTSPWPPAGQPVTNEVWVQRNRYDERYSSYALQLGWRQPWLESVAVWGELGAVRETWSRSGGSTVSFYEGTSEPEEFDLPPASANEWAWTAAAGVDFALGQTAELSVGVDYQNRGYFPSVATLIGTLHRPSSSLLQGVIRYQQKFAGPWQGFVEYRPSEKRQYWQAGVGYRF